MSFRTTALAAAIALAPTSLGTRHIFTDVSNPPAVAREFRAVWVTPVSGGGQGDWPSRSGMSADEQKAELRVLLDCAKAAGINAVIMHVRTAADAFYPTRLAPWSAFLTGQSGKDPGYDPLAFAIAEAHSRGLQFHAWFNPFRAMLPNFARHAAPNHVTKTHPEWIRHYGTQTWMDPGIPAARKAVLEAVAEVVRRYDVDGVHIDDYFYPYRESETLVKRVHHRKVRYRRDIPFPDNASWKKYGVREGWTDRADWRRHNVNELVQGLYETVKREKPWVAVGVSPFGIWRSGTPAGVTGLDAYGEIYADSRLWLREGWLDYLAPQLYWRLDGEQRRFIALDSWWSTQNPKQRYIWPGLATWNVERIGWSGHEIASEVSAIRDARNISGGVPGHVHFRAGSLVQGGRSLATVLHEEVYKDPALVPPFAWAGSTAPAKPVVVPKPPMSASQGTITVAPGDTVTVAWWLVQTLGGDGAWSTALRRADRPGASIVVDTTGARGVAVSALNRVGQQGPAITLSW